MKAIKPLTFLCVCAFLIGACQAIPVQQSIQNDTGNQITWQIYSSTKYQLTVRFPSTWKVMELPTPEFPTIRDQVWFVSETLPQPQTDSRADIAFIFTQEDPSSSWEPQYFDNYQSDKIWLGDIQARRISGTNKESKSPEMVVLAKVGDYYLQALSNQSKASLEYFNPVISSIQFVQVEAETPSPSATSTQSEPGEKTSANSISTDTPSVRVTPTTEPLCFVSGFTPVAFMPDGKRILFRSENGVQIFNLQTLEEEEFLAAPTKLNYPAVALSPDGEYLAWALEDFSIQLIRISDKKLLHTLTGHTDIVGKLSFSPKGDRLFSASHDTWVRIWDIEGNLVHAFQPTGALDWPNEVLGIGISPDGTMLGTIPFDGPVKLWDLKDYKLVRELGSFGGYDTSDISFSPDGQLVASDTANGLFLWKTSDGTELLGGNPGINSMAMAFSPDGRFLAYGEIGEESNIVLSSPDGTQKIRTLKGHPGPIGILIFSPDSSLLLSSDWVETRIWQVEDGRLMYIGKSACP